MAMFRPRALRGAATLGLAGAALVLAASPVSAHDNVIVLGKNQASITSNHHLLTVCDNEDDGRYVYAEARTSPWSIVTRHIDTYNGVGNCSRFASYPGLSGMWRLCEVGPTGCSPWQPV